MGGVGAPNHTFIVQESTVKRVVNSALSFIGFYKDKNELFMKYFYEI